jgi:hypothetical protein
VPTKVPRGKDVFTVVQYQIDDRDLGVGKGPEHWVHLKTSNKKGGYELSNKDLNPINLAIDGQTDLAPDEIASRRPKDRILPKPGSLVGPLAEGKVILKDGRLTRPPPEPQGDQKQKKKGESSEMEGLSPSKNKSANKMDSLPSEEEADDHQSDDQEGNTEEHQDEPADNLGANTGDGGDGSDRESDRTDSDNDDGDERDDAKKEKTKIKKKKKNKNKKKSGEEEPDSSETVTTRKEKTAEEEEPDASEKENNQNEIHDPIKVSLCCSIR